MHVDALLFADPNPSVLPTCADARLRPSSPLLLPSLHPSLPFPSRFSPCSPPQAFAATKYALPDTVDAQERITKETRERIKDVNTVVNQTEAYRRQKLQAVADQVEEWEKQVQTLNPQPCRGYRRLVWLKAESDIDSQHPERCRWSARRAFVTP